jgi:hypothetical protein
MNAVVKHDAPMAIISDTSAILAVIARAASDQAVDIDKMERLLQMQERVLARGAEAEFSTALAAMQPSLPSIDEKGSIKNRDGQVQSTYALWEDINDAIKPMLSEHGFALSFRVAEREGKTIVTGVLSHRSGHRETTDITLPADTSGSKNAVQAIGSSISYGKRYAAGALLNFTSRGEDDDGKAAGKAVKNSDGKPQDGMQLKDLSEKRQVIIREYAEEILGLADAGKLDSAASKWRELTISHEEKIALWGLLPSHHRTSINRIIKR